jgi:hypothetical protein
MKMVMNPTVTKMDNFWGKWHHIYFDNFFSSTNLMIMLWNRKRCGTTRANRKNWPTELRKPNALKLKRGKSRKMQQEDARLLDAVTPVAFTCFTPPPPAQRPQHTAQNTYATDLVF